MELTILQKQAMGLDDSHLIEWSQGQRAFLLHQHMIDSLQQLKQAAQYAGFDLQLVSAYRSFERQLAIWNAKAAGQRDLLDDQGQVLCYDRLSDSEKLAAILRWSALPGLSRHHWGSDVDVFDASGMALDDVQLVPSEVEGNGPCAAMHDWLSECISNNTSFGFFRPYAVDTGGVAPERWHLSYLPLAADIFRQLSGEVMLEVWRESGLLLLDQVIERQSDIWQKYVTVSLQGQPDWVCKGLSCSC